MVHRVAFWIAQNGIKQGLLNGEVKKVVGMDDEFIPTTLLTGDAGIFYDELIYMLIHGMHAFNSPVWFNVGVVETPQCSACFIQSVEDDMGSITSLSQREVMLFKQGSGTGSNLSPLRSSHEGLSGGGKASGPVSFMKMFDSGAGVTKSGGTTRRAAKMVVMNADHPDILEQANGEPGFITCKSFAEKLAQDLYSTGKYSAEWNKPGNVYDLVPYQNANNSVRVTDEFMKAVVNDEEWHTRKVTNGQVVHTYKARDLWKAISEAAYVTGDPGIQFDTITNLWHTCPESGRINASNPCSEYLFLDDTACNLSSLNLLKFADGKKFKIDWFIHACTVATAAKEIIVDASSYPSPLLAERSHKFRTLGLGYTNLGALLTYWGIAYDSKTGRDVAAYITSIMTGTAYVTSAKMAEILGPFPEYKKNARQMLRVIDKHRDAHYSLGVPAFNELENSLYKAGAELWDMTIKLGEQFGFRNAQVTVLAPTGTISFLMDCDTTSIEPATAFVSFKKLVGQGTIIIVSKVLAGALFNLGYSVNVVAGIIKHVEAGGDIYSAPGFDMKHGPVFAQALGPYALRPEAHVDMMAAVQPFLSGGISKTVNMPNDATPAQIADIYMRAWRSGLKCIAVFRDGCKLSQPIATKLTDSSAAEKKMAWGDRRRLTKTRQSITHKFQIGPQEGYLTVGLYPDGSMGEIFIEVAKQGSTLMGLVDAWAQAISIGIQHGVPFEVMKDKFQDMSFDPLGFTGEEGIARAKSIPDYVFRWLEQNIIRDKGSFIVIDDEPSEAAYEPVKVASTSASLDGPPCSSCGNLTRRSGSCYVCTSCGTTTGCS